MLETPRTSGGTIVQFEKQTGKNCFNRKAALFGSLVSAVQVCTNHSVHTVSGCDLRVETICVSAIVPGSSSTDVLEP